MNKRRSGQFELSPIKEIELAAARVPGAVSLAQGIPSFDTPEVIKNYVKEKLDQGLAAKYSLTPGLPELRELVAESLLREGMRYDPDGEIIITAGSIEAISATLLALTSPGSEIILPSPCYASYQQAIRMAGCVPRFVPLDEERNFDLDVEAIARKISPRTAAIFYCNPNNPTGTIYSRGQTLRMLELAERHNLIVITDEVYKDFLYTDAPYFSPAQVEPYRERVVRIFSFSKAYAMTGWRVGYLHTGRALATEILKAHDALVTCAPVISQHAAVAALEYGQEAVAGFREVYRQRRDLTLEHLDSLSHIFDYQKPNGAYFVFPRVKDTVRMSGDSRALALDLLEKARVAVVPGIAFGPTGEAHLRMSFGREEAEIEEAFRRMRPYFQGLQTGRGTVYAFPETPPREAGGEPSPPNATGRPAAGGLRRRVRGLAVGYLSLLARLYLLRKRPGVVAIAGNRGKTVCKRTITELLQKDFPARANPRSYNTEIGLPLAVLGLEIDPRRLRTIVRTLAAATWRAFFHRERLEWLVLELGTRQAGDMAALLRTVTPAWAIITGLSDGEGGEPADMAVLQQEMAALAGGLPPSRLLVSGDDPLLAALADPPGGGPMTIRRASLVPEGGGFRFAAGACEYQLGNDLVGQSAVYALQAALLLGEKLGMAPARLATFAEEISGRPKPAARPGGESAGAGGGC